MRADAYRDDIGTIIILDTGVDLSGATTHTIEVRKPSESEVSWTGSIVETTKVQYTIADGDFDEAGPYKMQTYVALPSGWSGRGNTVEIFVADLFQ